MRLISWWNSGTGGNNAASDPYDAFVKSIQPMVDRIINEVNSHPEFINRLHESFAEVCLLVATRVATLLAVMLCALYGIVTN